MTPETEALCKRLETVESDPIGAGLSNNRYRNPDGPEAAAKLREMAGALEKARKALRAVELARHTDEPTDWHRATKLTDAALGGSHD